jgi:hypothetical protein
MGHCSPVYPAYRLNNDSLINVFQKKLDSLQVVVANLSNNEMQKSSSAYDKSYRNAKTAIHVLEQLNGTVYSMLADRKDAEKYSILSQINSPASNKLGFVFSDKIISIAEQVISSSNIANDQKQRLRSSILNIVEGLKSVFPPLNIVTTVVSTFASFNSPYIDKLNKRIKEGDSLAVKVINPISQRMLKQFADSIMPYINFYQQLNNISLQFENDLKDHRVKYNHYYPNISNLKSHYNDEVNINVSATPGPLDDALDVLYEKSVQIKNNSFYSRVINKQAVVKINKLSSQSVVLAQEFKPFYDDYYKILNKHFDDNVLMLEKAKQLKGSSSVEIDKLKEYLEGLKSSSDKTSPGFEVKFEKNLEKIISSISDINTATY